MATIKFLLQSSSTEAGIYVRLKEGRTIDVKAKTKFIIDAKDWSSVKGQPVNTKTDARKRLQNDLEALRASVASHYNKTANRLEVTTQWLKDFLNPPQAVNQVPGSLVAYFEYYEKAKEAELKKPSIVKLNVVKNLLRRFEADTKSNFQVKDVDDVFKDRFISYSLSQGYAPNTTARNFRFIKTVCYHAGGNGIDISPKLKGIRMKTVKVEKVFLTPEDIAMIEAQKIEQDHLTNARDWLLISCETGQRVSDFLRFRKEMIRYKGKVPLIEFTQKKTGKIMTVPLSKKVLSILKRREGEFPRKISDQKLNDYIKEVCKLAGLTYKTKGSLINKKTNRKVLGVFEKWQLVSSHIGRRSFATNNYGKIPTSLLIAATGHTTEAMFLEYIGKSNEDKALELAKYF
jgi:integrase